MSDDRFDPKARGNRWLDAYYYSFGATGTVEVDNILAAVATAGKAHHNTSEWQEPNWGAESCADAIQRMADDAAAALTASRGQAERLRADITAARDIAATRGGVPGRGYAESAVDTATWLVEALEEARADLHEARLRLAIWSGEGVPEGWEAAADGEPYLVRRRGEWAVTLDPHARVGFAWAGWWRLGEDDCAEQVIASTAAATEALAAAEAWLAGVAP